ncbi:MAG: toxin-antitoxin system, toxin component [candidate division NC10 bacterium]|nr:toxin-antitoxin system, toxin component [candidate division NC10 bacterium]
MRKYHERPMDLADAAPVRVAERERLRAVFTLDHRDFRIYRAAHGKPFTLIPDTL